jgi:hypothetical protein
MPGEQLVVRVAGENHLHGARGELGEEVAGEKQRTGDGSEDSIELTTS